MLFFPKLKAMDFWIEFKNEGWVLGVGASIFKIAGPVIAYGTLASVIYGVIYWVTTLFKKSLPLGKGGYSERLDQTGQAFLRLLWNNILEEN